MASRRMRSRGCDQCRRRRVKCDETGNFCRQCLRFGLDCSGPVRGVTIIDMTPEAAFPLERAGTPLDRRPKKIRKTSVPLRTAASSSSSKSSSEEPASSASPNKDLPATEIILRTERQRRSGAGANGTARMLYQPSTTEATELFLVSQFLSFSRTDDAPGLPPSWLSKLPELMLASKVPAFRYSIRATTMALHARLHHSPPARMEAYRWYIVTLNKFRTHLSGETKKGLIEGNEKFVPGPEEILIPTFLCLFEAIANDSPQRPAVMQHLIAACNILELRGPEGCKEGLFHQMFITWRVSSSLIAIFTGLPSRFATEDWRNIPFDGRGKNLLHQLVDIILVMPFFLLRAGYIGPMEGTVRKIATSDALPVGLERIYRRLSLQLDMWWEAFKQTSPEESDMLFTMTGPESMEYKKVGGVQYSPTLFLQQDRVNAFTVTLYHATNLIIHTILHALSIVSTRLGCPNSHPRGASHHLEQAISHSNSILDISSHQEEKKPNGMDLMDSMRTMFALRIVHNLSPPEQSTKASALMRQFHATKNIPKLVQEGQSQPVGPPHATALRIAAIQNKIADKG